MEEFLDSSKRIIGDVRHRSLYHHTEGAWLAQSIFGVTIEVQVGTRKIEVPTRLVVERHIIEDLGWLPSPKDYIDGMLLKPWMGGAQRKEVDMSEVLK